jgi:hypothetical protein
MPARSIAGRWTMLACWGGAEWNPPGDGENLSVLEHPAGRFKLAFCFNRQGLRHLANAQWRIFRNADLEN